MDLLVIRADGLSDAMRVDVSRVHDAVVSMLMLTAQPATTEI
jgi:hypothetical protein